MNPSILIHPGGFFFGESHHRIHTTLGSCVAITLWHPFLLIGGMCHFVLPGKAEYASVKHTIARLEGHYADDAMALFEQAAQRHGTKLTEYQARIFGGADMVGNPSAEQSGLVGFRNTQAALAHVEQRGILLLHTHVGETGSRHISFNLERGEVERRHTPLREFAV